MYWRGGSFSKGYEKPRKISPGKRVWKIRPKTVNPKDTPSRSAQERISELMKTRTFKVMEAMATEKGAHLRFRGQWLVEAGFHPGLVFTATPISPGLLELRVAAPVHTHNAAYFAACEQLDRVLA